MKNMHLLPLALGALPITLAQVLSWCKDEDCGDCPSSVIAGPNEYPECIIYEAETVFGGDGFKKGTTPSIEYEVFAYMLSVPCGGEPGVECKGWQLDLYAPSDLAVLYFVNKNTMIITSTVGPYTKDTQIHLSYDQTLEVSTTFELSVGDPLGIITAKLGVAFARSETRAVTYDFIVPAGAVGRVGFTPVCVCSKGRLTDCDGKISDETERCAPYKPGGSISVQGDYTLVRSL